MSRSTLTALAAAMAFIAAQPAAAQPADAPQVRITGTRAELPDAATLRAMTGEFALSDGRQLRVLRPGLHLMVAIDEGWARSVEPIGEHQFASRDGRLVVAFDPGLDTLRVIENQRVAVASRSGGSTLR